VEKVVEKLDIEKIVEVLSEPEEHDETSLSGRADAPTQPSAPSQPI